MRGVNRVTLIGNLGKDPDIQHLEGNIGVAKFRWLPQKLSKTEQAN
jgi:single-stranded DNA-binding protein